MNETLFGPPLINLPLKAYSMRSCKSIRSIRIAIIYIGWQISLAPAPFPKPNQKPKLKISQTSAIKNFEGYFNTIYWAKLGICGITFDTI